MTTWDSNILVIAAAVVVLLALVLLRVLRRRQRVSLSDQPAATERRQFAPRDLPDPAPAPLAGDATLQAASLRAAAAPVDPVAPAEVAVADEADALTTIKGLGPKAAARLGELGITRFGQIAALDADGVARLDAQMGAFRGRLARDRWVEQARLLEAGDRDAFEAQFGRIG